MLLDTVTSIVVALITGYAVLSSSFVEAAYQEDINGWVGNTVRLPCLVDTKTCGNLHSIKWYRGSSRIFMYSGIANFRKPEGDYERRANFVYQENDTTSYLEVNNIKINDEAVYKCEITYLDVAENCLVVQFINLTTLIAPSFLKITKENGDEIKNGASIGPFNEDSSLTLVCAVAEGKPIPLLRWFKNGAEVSGVYKPEIGSNIMGAATNVKRITVSRNDLGAVYECRATSHALNQTMTAAVDINVNVKPLKMNLSGLENPVRQNTTVVLQCIAQQAKPAAVLTWYNASRRLDEKENQISQTTETNSVTRTKVIKNPDGTFNTVSRLRFTATRYENTKIFRCIASNDVMNEQDRPSFERKITVNVLYPPIITIVPDRITVNESTNVYLNCTHDSNPFYIEERFWYFNGQKLAKNITLYEMRDNTLFLKRVNHKSMGKYFCGLRNSVGATNSSEIELNVLYPPTVYVEADNPVTVNESAAANVSLFCRVFTGNPRNLSNVQWYFNGKPMYKYPNASNLFLEKVQRGHHGNYSCAGMTDAGWGAQSVSKEVIVQYEPGPANVSYRVEYANGTSYNMDVIVKGTVVYLTCHVATLGRPNATVYHWYEGANEIFKDVNGSELKLSSVGVKSKLNNYSCSAQNAAGFGPNATVSLNIGAPPSIITSTKFFYVTRTDKETTLSCDIECDPRCDIYWLKDNVKLVNDDVYQVRNEVVPATLERNDFECIRSELRLNLEKFPGGHAEPYRDDAIYTCRSSPNAVGPAVSTNIEFKVYFAPTNVTVRQTKVQVTDNRIPPKVTCSAVGRPEPTFRWYNGSSNATFSQGATLSFNAPLSRDASTNFTCEAHNSYGIDTTVVYFEILYKPVCSIRITKSEDKKLLLCEADGNPAPYQFNWTSLDDGENVNIHSDERGSFLEIESMAENRVYNCTATNEINTSDPCSIEVPASEDWWLFRMFRSYDVSVAYLIIAVIVIVIALVVCVLIIFICRKRRANEKCKYLYAKRSKPP